MILKIFCWKVKWSKIMDNFKTCEVIKNKRKMILCLTALCLGVDKSWKWMQPKVSYQKITRELTVRIIIIYFFLIYLLFFNQIKLSLAMVMVQKIAGHEPARKIGDMRVTGKNIIQGSRDNESVMRLRITDRCSWARYKS